MKKRLRIFSLAFVCCLVLFTGTVMAGDRVIKSYKYDWNIFYNTSMNYHDYEYVHIPNWSEFDYSDEVEVERHWNYIRYEVTHYYTGGY